MARRSIRGYTAPLSEEDKAIHERRLAEEALRRQRLDYLNASKRGWTLEGAVDIIGNILRTANVRGQRSNLYDSRDDLSLRVERSFGVAADLYIHLRTDYDSKIVNPDNEKQAAGTYLVQIEIGWSGTSRSIAAATASIALYRELVDLGAEIAALMEQNSVRWVWDFSPKEPEIPAPVVAEAEKLPTSTE